MALVKHCLILSLVMASSFLATSTQIFLGKVLKSQLEMD